MRSDVEVMTLRAQPGRPAEAGMVVPVVMREPKHLPEPIAGTRLKSSRRPIRIEPHLLTCQRNV